MFPMYFSIDRKPDRGCDIQDSSNSKLVMMMVLILVKNLVEE